jgi:hypothetical protein
LQKLFSAREAGHCGRTKQEGEAGESCDCLRGHLHKQTPGWAFGMAICPDKEATLH